MITILNYTTLKHKSKPWVDLMSLITILNYTTLKLFEPRSYAIKRLITILNYTTLKPQIADTKHEILP